MNISHSKTFTNTFILLAAMLYSSLMNRRIKSVKNRIFDCVQSVAQLYINRDGRGLPSILIQYEQLLLIPYTENIIKLLPSPSFFFLRVTMLRKKAISLDCQITAPIVKIYSGNSSLISFARNGAGRGTFYQGRNMLIKPY